MLKVKKALDVKRKPTVPLGRKKYVVHTRYPVMMEDTSTSSQVSNPPTLRRSHWSTTPGPWGDQARRCPLQTITTRELLLVPKIPWKKKKKISQKLEELSHGDRTPPRGNPMLFGRESSRNKKNTAKSINKRHGLWLFRHFTRLSETGACSLLAGAPRSRC